MLLGLQRLGYAGVLEIELIVENPHRVKLRGYKGRFKHWEKLPDGRFRKVLRKHNAFVNTGLNISLDRMFGINGPPAAVGWIGVDNDATAVTAATTFLHGASGATAANQIIKAISPAATRTNQTVTAGATFANADFTSGVFIIHKIGFLDTSTDAGTGLIDVIGGSGSAPYNKPLTLDLTSAGSFTLTMQIQVTAQAV